MTDSGWMLYKRLLGYVKPHWRAFALAVVGFVIYAASSTALAEMMKRLIDGIQNPDADFRFFLPLFVVLMFASRGLGTFLSTYFMAYVGRYVIHTLRCDVFAHLLHLPGRFFDQHSSGHLVSRVTYHVEQVAGAATNAVTIILREGLFVVGLVGYLFWTNWMLTLLFLGVTPIIAGVVSYVSKRFRRISKRIQHSMGDVTHVASEALSGYRVVRTHGAEAYEKQRFERVSEENRRQSMKEAMTRAVSSPVVLMLVAISMALLVWLAMAPSLMENMTPGEFVAFITAAALMIKPVRQLTEINSEIQKGIAAASELFGLLDLTPEQDEGSLIPSKLTGNVVIENVSFRYGDDQPSVLHNVNLNVAPGELVAIVGRSGSGKSTLVSLLPRFYCPSEGQILIDGVNADEYALGPLRQNIALVSQQVTLFNASIADNIAYGVADPDPAAIKAAAEAAYASEFIEKLPESYATVVGENGVMLSGGQRQRLAIARAIFKDAPILILDEATSALDTESERYIQKALEHVCKGRTTLVIAHRLSTIERADRILVMDQGRIIEQGTHQALLEKGGAYAALHQLQFQESE
ncbi:MULTISPECIES: lipid A export permease/ATP-binding protein MsbA [Halomonadaceae]|mgnify:FL=1|uniref:Lipid A export ATP-binding/permease protein MsbA n=1 Tax=Vreelandella aquamarina TaxID=77097 RepID=A0A0D7V1C2_9GAMM|nr:MULTISPECIES: lipid A export permease/ATP-binding protein MsbA [Halomonas]KTG25674.1 lipid A export permease/ATP-binding protein MsbA [Idiomarina sp. H105]MEC8902778.1 lipid A export permease/ATP-binding protein MsbA [Pseudomonadota bacterium]OAE95508.1 lipid A export permease/ATP-binding protein MsbA [Idiomarina sp. WRN-38]KJD19507.1 lipid transporter ATP-binding/permease [Halomonas meridiana]MCC4287221.1 lipid A export permease/ATP-binding protein MsbA [Halomonas meridiana]